MLFVGFGGVCVYVCVKDMTLALLYKKPIGHNPNLWRK